MTAARLPLRADERLVLTLLAAACASAAQRLDSTVLAKLADAINSLDARRFVGVELKASYYRQAVANLHTASTRRQPSLFAGGAA